MGNEGSVPQTGEEELESQARDPPSAILPSQGHGANMPQGGTSQPHSRGGRMINAVFHRRQNGAANATTGSYRHQTGAPPMQPEDMVMMSPEEQQQYYQEQQELYLQSQQQQHQQQQQQQQHYNQGYNVNGDTSYSGQAPSAPSAAPVKKGLGFRPSGRAGAAIINSMKNLSLGSGVLHRGNQHSSSKLGGMGSSTNTKEWETKWDEDDSDGEEEIHAKPPAHQNSVSPAPPLHPSSHQHHDVSTMPPMVRPGLDVGLSSPPPTSAIAPMSPTEQPQTKAHLVTATPEQPGMEDGVEWDTGVVPPDSLDYEKPNVQMFLPLLRVLGKGSFGKVVLVQKRVGAERGQLFAMKILRKTHLVRRRQIERTRTERKVLSVVNHPFIMKLHYAFQSPDKLYLVLDYCPGGELFFHLSRFRRFPERVARFYAAELLLALGHLHKRGIIYRDLKPENVLLDAEGHVKLGDFGLAKAGIQHACEGATSMCGTPEYMAPEVLAQQGHGFCVDYWGLGMLVYEMMTGLPPWYTTDRTRLFRRLRSAPLDIPSYFSPSSANCVTVLLERNPRRRLGVTGIRAAMEHEFFRSISWRALYGRRVEAPIRPCEGWSPAGGSQDDARLPDMNGDNPDLDAATANFDNTFTRMPVETDDNLDASNGADTEDLEELHEDTFVGFTFDDNDREEVNSATPMQPHTGSERQRTHHYYAQNGDMQQQQHHAASHPSQGAPTGHQID